MIRQLYSDAEVFSVRSTQSWKKTFVLFVFSNRLKFIMMPLCLGFLFDLGELTAGTVCRKASVVRQLDTLTELQIMFDGGGVPTANEKKESDKRKVKIKNLRKEFCFSLPTEIQFDRFEKLGGQNCQLYTGLSTGQRVYWGRCPDCEHGGGCE